MAEALSRAGAAPTGFDALPNDVVVSLFEKLLEPEFVLSPYERERRRANNLRWVRETFPLVCRRWRDLYNSQQASPLHETLEVDAGECLGDAVDSWARRHSRDVRTLRVVASRHGFISITDASLSTLVKILAPHLDEIEISEGLSSLVRAPFWEAMRRDVAPAGRLRKLKVEEFDVSLSQNDVAFFGQLTRLEELSLNNLDLDAPSDGGLRGFPASVLACTDLRRLNLSFNAAVTSIPPGISSLQKLESLVLRSCGLRSLPGELGALTRLTELNVGENVGLGRTAEDVAFPSALGGLKSSLRRFMLDGCGLRSVPRFVGDLKVLEFLDLCYNDELGPHGDVFATPFPRMTALTALHLSLCGLTSVPRAVLNSMPRLLTLTLYGGRLADLPEELGRRLPQLREIHLGGNAFVAFPLRALAGCSSLERVELRGCLGMQVDEPLDALVENLPRLREVCMTRTSGEWTRESRARLEALRAALLARDARAVVVF